MTSYIQILLLSLCFRNNEYIQVLRQLEDAYVCNTHPYKVIH